MAPPPHPIDIPKGEQTGNKRGTNHEQGIPEGTNHEQMYPEGEHMWNIG